MIITAGRAPTILTVPVSEAAAQVNLLSGMKLQNYKTGGHIDVFLDRFEVYCNGANMHESKKSSCLLNALDEVTFRIITKELPQADKCDVEVIKQYMKNRFLPPHGEGQLCLLFRNCKQEENQDLQSFYTELLAKGA